MLVYCDLNEVYILQHVFFLPEFILICTEVATRCKLFTKAIINFTMNNKGNSLSISVTDKRSYVYTIDNISQGIFLSNCSLYQQI